MVDIIPPKLIQCTFDFDVLDAQSFCPPAKPHHLDIEHTTHDCGCGGKHCSTCKQRRCLGNFHRFVHSKDGFRTTCKICRKEERETEEFKAKRREQDRKNADSINKRKRDAYSLNPELHRQRNKTWRDKHPEAARTSMQKYNRSEKGKARERRWRELNPKKVKTIRANSWSLHWEAYMPKILAYRQSHRLEHRLHALPRNAKRRTMKTHAGGSFTLAEWETLKSKYDYTCLKCGKCEPEIKLTADHIIPVVKHGTSFINNIQPLCGPCNTSKGTKIIDYRHSGIYNNPTDTAS